MTRKNFIVTTLLSAGTLLAGVAGIKWWTEKKKKAPVTGKIHGAPAERGHMLRAGNRKVGSQTRPYDFPPSSETIRTDVLIAGGGISGLSAARQLKRSGISEFILLELDDETGGNSRSGKNEVSAYPWGAHYLPIPSPENKDLVDLLAELKVITGFDAAGLPVYDETYLCGDPQERLLIHGYWQEGLVPHTGVPPEDLEQIKAFLQFTESLKSQKGVDGKDLFALPSAESSVDPEWLKLDAITMSAYLHSKGWSSEYLRWYIDYCCRDDFGTGIDETSAWAGLHYFCSRKGKGANAHAGSVLTWPEGNGWLASQLAAGVRSHIRTGCVVYSIENSEQGVTAEYFDTRVNKSFRVEAKSVICAMPQFIAGRIVKNYPVERSSGFSYSPWLVANITLDHRPGGEGAALSWDNVQYGSKSLGYIHARHQNLRGFPDPETVVTCYEAMSDQDPVEARNLLHNLSWEECRDRVLTDFEVLHPGISEYVRSVDVWKWGHAMVRPVPGFITSAVRKEAGASIGNIHFAHSDLAGMSLFEEAFYYGVKAGRDSVSGSFEF